MPGTYTPETIDKDVEREKIAVHGATIQLHGLRNMASRGNEKAEAEMPKAKEELKQAVFSYQHMIWVRYNIEKEWAETKLRDV